MINKVYFVGEYGYAFRQLLPFLEIYHEELEIITWSSICKIIDILWPNKYITIPAENFISSNKRDCLLLRDVESVRTLELKGYVNICALDLDKKYFSMDAHSVFGIVNKKLIYGDQHDEKLYVSIFPRNREIQKVKNNIGQQHIDWLNIKYPGKEVVGHGLKDERIDLNIRYCKDIYEQINVFNNSEVFLTPSSGIADLALMCGCDIILTCDYPNIEKTNIHKCNIECWNNIKGK